jgi:hypothetical protein
MNICNLCHKDNKDVLLALDTGMKENQDIMKNNIAMLKAKIGVKP